MVTIKLFGMTKSLAGNQDFLALAMANGQRVKDLVELLEAGYPMIGELVHKKKVLVSVNQEIAHEETEIRDGDEVALLPPFAGGTPQDVETGRQRYWKAKAEMKEIRSLLNLDLDLSLPHSLDSQFEHPVEPR